MESKWQSPWTALHLECVCIRGYYPIQNKKVCEFVTHTFYYYSSAASQCFAFLAIKGSFAVCGRRPRALPYGTHHL